MLIPTKKASWTSMNGTVYVYNEETEKLITLEEEAVGLWRLIENGATKRDLLYFCESSKNSLEYSDIEQGVEALLELGVVEYDK